MPSRSKARSELFEKRFLLACSFLVAASICVWTISVATNYWFIAVPVGEDDPIIIGEPKAKNGTKYFEGGHLGIFNVCTYGFVDFHNTTTQSYYECHKNNVVMQDDTVSISNTKFADSDKSQGTGTPEASFAIINFFLMIMGFSFSIYTFRNTRYMFKRLAAAVHFCSSACVQIVIQILLGKNDYGSKTENWIFPKSVEISYGYSLFLAWFVFVANLFACFAFVWYSKKRKGDIGTTDEFAMADEPTIIGR